MLAKHFRNLKSLEIRGCTIANRVLRIILEDHKNLELLDTQDDDDYHYHFVEAHVAEKVNKENRRVSKSYVIPNINLAQKNIRWDKLPQKVLLKIMKLLPDQFWVFERQILSVCRSWQSHGNRHSLIRCFHQIMCLICESLIQVSGNHGTVCSLNTSRLC